MAAVQPLIHLPYPTADRFDASAIEKNVAASVRSIEQAKQMHDASFVAFPEFFLTGYTLGVDVAGWIQASIQIPGPETDALCRAAAANEVYVAGCAYERIEKFPGRFFNTAFVIDPSGEIILIYRKLYAMTSKTRPIDVYDEWVAEYGVESFFPVADTPIGRIGAMIARDAYWPEMARSLALRGAEIFYNPYAAGEQPDDAGIFARRSRAYENHCYLIAPNIGPFVVDGVLNTDLGRAETDIIDFRGNVISMAKGETDFLVTGSVDIEALRTFRDTGNPKGNFLAQLQSQLHAPIYAEIDAFPKNAWRDKPIQTGQENKSLEREVLAKMFNSGVMVAPSSS